MARFGNRRTYYAAVGQVEIAGEAGQEANPGNIRASGHGFGSCRTYCQMGVHKKQPGPIRSWIWEPEDNIHHL